MWKPEEDQYYEARESKVAKYLIKFDGVRRLSDVPSQVWFTPAVMYLWGMFSDTYLADVLSRTNARIYWHKFDKPIFSGFQLGGDVSWNHTLWAIDAHSWPRFLDRILEMLLLNREGRTLCRYALQELQVLDPLYAASSVLTGSDVPLASIFSFAVKSNQHQLAFTRLAWGVSLPSIRRLPPDDDESVLASRLFSAKLLTTEQAFDIAKQAQLQRDQAAFIAKRNEL